MYTIYIHIYISKLVSQKAVTVVILVDLMPLNATKCRPRHLYLMFTTKDEELT